MKKQEKKETPKKVITKKQSLSLTPEENAIAQRIMGSTADDWQSITEESVMDFAMSETPWKPPKWAQKLREEKRFAFRWVTRKPERLDEVRNLPVPRKWFPVNAANMAQFGFDEGAYEEACKDLDSVLGCICNLDQMLVFKPWWMFAKELDMKRAIAENRDGSGDIDKRDGIGDDHYQWQAGQQHKIDGRDVVMADESEFLESTESGEGLEDIVTEE